MSSHQHENTAAHDHEEKTVKKKEHGFVTFLKTLASLILTLVLAGTVGGTVAGIVTRRTLADETVSDFVNTAMAQDTIKLLKFASSWLMTALLAVIFVLLLVLLIALNKRYFHKFFLYLSIASGIPGLMGMVLRLFPGIIEKGLTGQLILQDADSLSVKGMTVQITGYLMQYSLILIGAWAAFLLLYLIIRRIKGMISDRREAKEEAKRQAAGEDEEASEDGDDTEETHKDTED